MQIQATFNNPPTTSLGAGATPNMMIGNQGDLIVSEL